MKSNLIDLEVVLHHQTEKAILVSEHEGADKVWLPKSIVEFDDRPVGSVITVTLPRSTAQEKGLI